MSNIDMNSKVPRKHVWQIGGWGGESNWEIVSFGSSSSHAPCLPSQNGAAEWGPALSLFPSWPGKCSFFPPLRSQSSFPTFEKLYRWHFGWHQSHQIICCGLMCNTAELNPHLDKKRQIETKRAPYRAMGHATLGHMVPLGLMGPVGR